MEKRWNLENIYSSIDCQELIDDITKYKNAIDRLNSCAKEKLTPEADPSAVIEDYIDLLNEVLILRKPALYLSLVLAADTGNTKALKLADKVSDISADLTVGESLFRQYIKSISLSDLRESPTIKEHLHFLEDAGREADYSLSPRVENALAKMKSTGSESWKKLWESITSSLTCDYRGKETSLFAVRGLAYSHDSSVRLDAYKSELKAYEKIADTGAACLNALKGEVINECRLRGYASPLEESALASGIDMDILGAMIAAIDENVEKLNKFYRIKAKYLGYERLPFFELFAPVGNDALTFTFDEARNIVEKVYESFSPKMGAFAKNAFAKDWIDPYPRGGKVGGAFCEDIKAVKESRILMNFSGNFEDIITLCHELGHGYHNEVLKNESPINSDYPMTVAETASTFCENLAFAAAENILPKSALLTVKESRLSGELQSIIDIYSRYLFEDSFFKERENGSLSAAEISALMENAQKKAYKNGLDTEYLHPYMWLCKPHYYDADFNYYNYPYAFGDLFARSLFAMYEENGSAFVPEYDKILKSTGGSSVKDVGLLAGIDFTDKNFWETGIQTILKDIDELETLMICSRKIM